MNTVEINPFVRLAMHSILPPNSHINRRVIFDYELICITAGKFNLDYNDQTFLCRQGDILLLCPGIPHSFHVIYGELTQPHIHFDVQYDFQSKHVFINYKDLPQLNATEQMMVRENIFPQLQNNPILSISDKEAFLHTFFQVVDIGATNSLEQKGYMLTLLSTIIQENAPTALTLSPADSDVPAMVKSYIDANYEHDLSLQSLEQQFGYSKYHLERLFKNKYGTPIIEYRNRRRIEAAVRLLQDHSVTEVAHLLGYSTIYAFSRSFRSICGTSPTQYLHERDGKKDSP